MTSRPEALKPSESLLLDIIRVCASIVVAAGHITQPYFSTGWPDLTFVAVAAVAVFFVLSGFVIRHATCRRPATLSSYLSDRASRVYSVVLPALFITLVADTIAHHVNPIFYKPWLIDSTQPILRILEGLTFTTQFWGRNVNPLSNSPFWSLSYEVAYYVIYGLMFYLVGRRRWFCVALALLLIGPKIILLFPVWLLGSYAQDAYGRWTADGRAASVTSRLMSIVFAVLMIVVVVGFIHHGFFRSVENTRKIYIKYLADLGMARSSDALTFYLEGFIFTIGLLWSLALVKKIKINPDHKSVRTIRFIAEGTFPIYLLHFPLYVLIAACIPYDHGSVIQKGLILLTVVVIGVLCGHPANLLKSKLRTLINLKSNKTVHS